MQKTDEIKTVIIRPNGGFSIFTLKGEKLTDLEKEPHVAAFFIEKQRSYRDFRLGYPNIGYIYPAKGSVVKWLRRLKTCSEWEE